MGATAARVGAFLSGGAPRDGGEVQGLLLVHLNVLAYSLCFWVQQPVLPFLSKELGANAVQFGTLESAMALLALLGGAMMGRLTDTRGAKLTLMLSHTGSLLMYSLMAVATSFPILFASRLPAFLQHAMLCAQAAVSSLVPVESRSVALGRLSLSYAVGMVTGSPMGGVLASKIGYQGTVACSAAVTLAVLVLDALYLPTFAKTTKTPEPAKDKPANASRSLRQRVIDHAAPVLRVATDPTVAALMAYVFPLSIGIGAFRSMLALGGKDTFGLESQNLGWFISFVAFVGLLTNVFLIRPLTQFAGEHGALMLAAVTQIACFTGIAQASSLSHLAMLMVPSTMASTTLYTLASSLITLAVDEHSTATAISLSHASRSLVGIVAPVIGGFVFDRFAFQGIGHFAALCAFISLCISFAFSARFRALGVVKAEADAKAAAAAAKNKSE